MNTGQLFETVTSLPVQIFLVVTTIAILGRINRNAATCCRLWTIGFFSILGLVAAAFLVAHLRLFDTGIDPNEQSARWIISVQTGILRLLATVWIAGCAIVVLRRASRFIALQFFLRRECRQMTHQELASLPLTDSDNVPQDLRWLVSKRAHGPFCWQMHRPTIVLPREILGDDSRILRHVLLHELEHLRTDHPLQHFLQGTCSTALWFHPAIWWAARDAELAREFHCDEVSAKEGHSIGSYLRTLTRFAERNADAHACTLAFGRKKSAIIRRTERLVSLSQNQTQETSHGGRTRERLSIGVLVLVVVLVSQVWLPVNVLASSRSRVSPWPSWTATVLHDWGLSVRDYERFDDRHRLRELMESDDD